MRTPFVAAALVVSSCLVGCARPVMVARDAPTGVVARADPQFDEPVRAPDPRTMHERADGGCPLPLGALAFVVPVALIGTMYLVSVPLHAEPGPASVSGSASDGAANAPLTMYERSRRRNGPPCPLDALVTWLEVPPRVLGLHPVLRR